MDFTPQSAAFYWQGFKAQLFLMRAEQREGEEESGAAKLLVFASSRRQMEAVDANVRHVERFFPGLRRASTQPLPGVQGRSDPTQVLFLGSSLSLAAQLVARHVAALVQAGSGGGQGEAAGGGGLVIKAARESEVVWLYETLEARRDVMAKEARRRSRRWLHAAKHASTPASSPPPCCCLPELARPSSARGAVRAVRAECAATEERTEVTGKGGGWWSGAGGSDAPRGGECSAGGGAGQ
eukprot:3939202-Rhodomonas_salina.1